MNNNQNIFFTFLVIIFLGFNLNNVMAQEVSEDEEITVVAPYQPTVSDAFKINISPRIPEEKLVKPEFDYSIVSKELHTTPELDPITAARIQGESVSKLYKNYITPYLEFYANNLHSKKSAFGVYVKHISSSGKIKDYAYPGNSHTRASVNAKRIWKKHNLTTNIFYDRKGVHFYGFKPAEFPEFEYEKKDISQHYQTVGFNSAFESNYSGEKNLNHKLALDYDYLFDKEGTSEHNIKLFAGLNKNFEFFSFSEHEKLGLDLDLDYYIFGDKISPTQNSGIIGIRPYYNMGFDQYNFRVGFKTAIAMNDSTRVHVYPTVHLEVKVVQDYLVTYAGLNGDLKKNSLHSLSLENPFIAQNIDKHFTNHKFSQYGGIKGRISKYLDYNLSFTNSTVDDMALFVNDTSSVMAPGLDNQFVVLYDYGRQSRIIAEFGFHYQEKFNATLKGQYNNYFLDTQVKPWHKPAFEFALLADYNIQNKIFIKAELFTRGKIYARTFEEQTSGWITTEVETVTEIKGMADLNLGFEYRYTKVLSGFLNFNNILGQRYYKWYNYPSYKFNMMLGVTYSF